MTNSDFIRLETAVATLSDEEIKALIARMQDLMRIAYRELANREWPIKAA